MICVLPVLACLTDVQAMRIADSRVCLTLNQVQHVENIKQVLNMLVFQFV